ncbi:HNH endonuclease [Xanthomonas campestris]|uniref:HNH endonuclease n=1 Tax=Xanthomonas campestris TaxID=339 RepID=UPI003CCFCA8F
MSNKRLKSLRIRAFHAQSGCCFYCDLPMWLASPNELGLRPRSARPFQCSAEHLLAKQDGGGDTPENIVAAHVVCNQRRHRITPPPSPEAYLARVSRKIAKNKWHPRSLDLKARVMVAPAPTSLL